jgi:hypothetical protein
LYLVIVLPLSRSNRKGKQSGITRHIIINVKMIAYGGTRAVRESLQLVTMIAAPSSRVVLVQGIRNEAECEPSHRLL